MATFIMKEKAHEAGVLSVAISDIHDELTLERIRFQSGCRVVPEQHSEAEIRQMVRLHSQKDSESILRDLGMQSERESSWESEPIINLVDSLLDTAIRQKATDIHLEPSEKGLRIRFRIDGMLHEYRTLPAWIAEPVIVRLKLLASVDITERRLPHDGSFAFESAYGNVSMRLSTIPVQGTEKSIEKCVLRLLQTNDSGATLDTLDFRPEIQKALRRAFNAPQGLFLVTGPTGSGKTTTLYAGLREIIARDINVTTIEDPVEYKLDGANQVQVNEKCGFTFATALRSILRQDPDVILVGEIRDAETAQIALRAAQTGHLVLATLHANRASAAASRLTDLGMDPKLLQESLLGVVAQRLVRTLDTENAHPQEGSHAYRGRTAIIEFMNADGSYAAGTLREDAERLVNQGRTDRTEIERVLG
jgi:general secretion pathway protein E